MRRLLTKLLAFAIDPGRFLSAYEHCHKLLNGYQDRVERVVSFSPGCTTSKYLIMRTRLINKSGPVE